MIQDLTPLAGFPVAIDLSSSQLIFGAGVQVTPPTVRTLAELSSVMADPSAPGPDPAYLLYRDVRTEDGGSILADTGLRYDLTVLLPGTIGREYVKTAGHVHLPSGSGFKYPEIYEVLHGRGAFLLQRMDRDIIGSWSIGDGWLLLAGPGDLIQIPGGLGHVTINLGTEPLVISDLVAAAARNDYRQFQEKRGAAWYVESEPFSSAGFLIRRNPSYPGAALPRIMSAASFSPGLKRGSPLYRDSLRNYLSRIPHLIDRKPSVFAVGIESR